MFPKARYKRLFIYHLPLPIVYRDGNTYLDTFALIITSSTQTAQDIEKIHSQVEKDVVSHGIAFSKAGLKELGVLAIPISIRALWSTRRNSLVTWLSTRSLRATVKLMVLF